MTQAARCLQSVCVYILIFFFFAVIKPQMGTANNHTRVANLQHLKTGLRRIDSLQTRLVRISLCEGAEMIYLR